MIIARYLATLVVVTLLIVAIFIIRNAACYAGMVMIGLGLWWFGFDIESVDLFNLAPYRIFGGVLVAAGATLYGVGLVRLLRRG